VTESHRGWEELKVRGSPTFVLPSGTQVWNPGAIGVKFDRHYEVVERTPADCPDGDCIRVFRDLLESAISQGAA